jgi:hypothetical protein
MDPSPWRVHFWIGDMGGFFEVIVEQRLTRFVPGNPTGRQTLWLPVHPMDAVSEAMPLLDPVYRHYLAQWPRIMQVSADPTGFVGGFYLDGSVLPEEIADPSHADELEVVAYKNIPPEVREFHPEPSEGGRPALRLDAHLIESAVWAKCVPAAEAGIEPYSG